MAPATRFVDKFGTEIVHAVVYRIPRNSSTPARDLEYKRGCGRWSKDIDLARVFAGAGPAKQHVYTEPEPDRVRFLYFVQPVRVRVRLSPASHSSHYVEGADLQPGAVAHWTK